MVSQSNTNFSESNQQVFNTAGTIIVSLMMACLAITVVLFGSRLMPDWNAIHLPLLCFLIALERISTYKRVKRLLVMSRTWLIYQLTQWLFILIVLKIVLLITKRPESLWLEIQLWRLDFFTYFFDNSYIFAIIFLVFIWSIAGYFAKLLDEMSLEESLIRYETSVMAPISGPPVRERLLAIVFALGFIQVILTAMMRVNMRMLISGEFESLSIQPLPYLAAGAWNVLIYFILGLVLMSQSQFARLNARWYFQKIQVTPKLAVKWATYSIIFIVFLAVGASLLPTYFEVCDWLPFIYHRYGLVPCHFYL